MGALLRTVLCSVVFTMGFLVANAGAAVTIQGSTDSYNVAIGDTLQIFGKRYLEFGDNFVRWEIVSGTGKFINETSDSTGFIPSSSSVVLRVVSRTLPAHKISETQSVFHVYEDFIVGMYYKYGAYMYFEAPSAGVYTLNVKASLGIVYYICSGDDVRMCSTSLSCSGGKCNVSMSAAGRQYFFIWSAYYPEVNPNDYLKVSIVRSYNLSTTVSGEGTAQIDSVHRRVTTYRGLLETDTVTITATPKEDNNFDHWEVASGTCSIRSSKSASTTVTGVKSDCQVKAVFTPGKIYEITGTPTKYSFGDNLFAKKVTKGEVGVRFTFKAPSSGTYAFVVSNSLLQDSIGYARYSSTDYATALTTKKVLGTYSEPVTLTAGQTVSIIVYQTSTKDQTFYISYSSQQSYKLTLSTDGNGYTVPSGGYTTTYTGVNNSVGARGKTGYRFSGWQEVSGTPTVDDKNAPYTYVAITGNAELKAVFKPSPVHTLSMAKQEFNYQRDYYHESTRSTVRFTWTPTDTLTYCIRIEPIDAIGATFVDYGNDSAFSQKVKSGTVKRATDFYFKGTPGKPYYWTLTNLTADIPNTRFNVWISLPYSLEVVAAKGGSVNPSGKTTYLTGETSYLTAWPHGGYKFESWDVVSGNVSLSSKTDFSTVATPKDSICVVKAMFSEDTATKPVLDILQLDLGNHPEICAQVSVTDAQTGHSFYGLDADDLVLTQDGIPIRPQVTSVNNVTGISVVIVVDESPSMADNNRFEKAKASIRSFINDMGPYDRTAIVGFLGYTDSTIVRQSMTSNKTLLLKAVDSLTTKGNGTNIISGAYAGIQQITNETNPTAVIIFSDGENNSGTIGIEEAVDLAKAKKTSIYSIGLETIEKEPLETLAKNSGGIYTFASDASELAGIYSAIRDNVLSQYIVCYQSPDTTQNGETHDVVLSMTFNNITASDTVQWNENALPPMISLTEDTWKLIETQQAANNPLTISVYISSPLKIDFANLYLRESGRENIPFTKYVMQNVSDSLWEFTVPANLVVSPGLDFYVIARDSIGQIGKTPRIQTPGMEPYTIFVDNDVPFVELVSVACENPSSDIKTFSFRISDSDGIERVTLYYKDFRDILYQKMPFEYSVENDTWNASFHAGTQDFSVINYYLRATDAKGATIRYLSSGYSVTGTCEIKTFEPGVGNDSIPEDPPGFTHRDSIELSLVADIAEIYDRDLDGKADFVRIHFNSESDNDVLSIDSIFWNSNRGEWRSAEQGSIEKNRTDAKWIEANINVPFPYGLTRADSVRRPYLSFAMANSAKLENVVLNDRVGVVPVRAVKRQGKLNLEKYMDPYSEMPPDTLTITISEPIRNTGDEDAWKDLFRYSTSCEDTVTHELNVSVAPAVEGNGLQWTLLLDDFVVKTGFCLRTNPKASFEDMAGNAPGLGGVEIKGMDGAVYITAIKPLQPVSGMGEAPQWIPPGGFAWEELPDTLSAIRVNVMAPYKADIYIFDGISVYVNHMEQEFGYDGEMADPLRENDDRSKLSFIYWDQLSDKGRKAGTGVYIWRINFTFDDGHKETVTVKTGIMRKARK